MEYPDCKEIVKSAWSKQRERLLSLVQSKSEFAREFRAVFDDFKGGTKTSIGDKVIDFFLDIVTYDGNLFCKLEKVTSIESANNCIYVFHDSPYSKNALKWAIINVLYALGKEDLYGVVDSSPLLAPEKVYVRDDISALEGSIAWENLIWYINSNYDESLGRVSKIKAIVDKNLQPSDRDLLEKYYAKCPENNQKLFLCMLFMKGCHVKNEWNKLIYYKCSKGKCVYGDIKVVQFIDKNEEEIKKLFMNSLAWKVTQPKLLEQMKVLAEVLLELAAKRMRIIPGGTMREVDKAAINFCKSQVGGV